CTGTDARVCRFLHVEYQAVATRVLDGATDKEVLEWCLTNGRRPNDEEVLIFNAFLSKRGWRDNQTAELEQMKQERGFGDRGDVQTFFDFHKGDEHED